MRMSSLVDKMMPALLPVGNESMTLASLRDTEACQVIHSEDYPPYGLLFTRYMTIFSFSCWVQQFVSISSNTAGTRKSLATSSLPLYRHSYSLERAIDREKCIFRRPSTQFLIMTTSHPEPTIHPGVSACHTHRAIRPSISQEDPGVWQNRIALEHQSSPSKTFLARS